MSMCDTTRKMAEMWNSLDYTDKVEYEDMAKADKKRYDKEVCIYYIMLCYYY